MAKSFLDQLLDFAGLKLPDSKGHYAPSAYRDEPSKAETSSGLSRVEKYLQNKNAGTERATTELTGVAKYLAEKEQEEKEKAEAEAALAKRRTATEMTGVARYLAKKQQEAQEKAQAEAAALANMTSVEKYLAGLAAKSKTVQSETAPASAKTPEKLTGVDKYLARQKDSEAGIQQAKTQTEAPKEAKAPAKAESVEKQTVEKAAQIKTTTEKNRESAVTPEKKATPKAKATSKIIDLADNAEQCQASTLKGTQCRRKSNLEVIEKTINHQKYKFSVCSQHNNDDFTPLPALLQKD